jgi:CxxC motif-containing protein (DUF1111 family)
MSRVSVASVAGLLGIVGVAILSMGQGQAPAPGDPLSNVTSAERELFTAGQAQFQNVEGIADGLGPVFNDVSCAACHQGVAVGGGSTRLESRFGQVVNEVYDPLTNLGGSLIQVQGIGLFNGVDFVGEVVPPQANVQAGRRTTPLFGLGLVDNVPDEVLNDIAKAEMDLSPSTAGRVNVVLDAASGQQRAGRFGWKCQEATLFSFSGDAYVNEMGITTPMFPVENCPQGNCALLATPGLPPVPNDSDNGDLVNLTNFMTFLAPAPKLALTPDAKAGALLFARVGCVNCHLPVLRTGPNASASLNNITFFPFSDFLLHDMGSLGDGIAQSGAGQTEMRTAPLWGVRLLTTFLHDGRANNLTDAILAHDGQGLAARNNFAALSATRQAQLIAFLNSL